MSPLVVLVITGLLAFAAAQGPTVPQLDAQALTLASVTSAAEFSAQAAATAPLLSSLISPLATDMALATQSLLESFASTASFLSAVVPPNETTAVLEVSEPERA